MRQQPAQVLHLGVERLLRSELFLVELFKFGQSSRY